MVEYESAYYRLADIVGQAHFSVGQQRGERFFHPCAMVQQGESAYVEQHHRQVLPHVEHYLY